MPSLRVSLPALKAFQGQRELDGSMALYDSVTESVVVVHGNSIHISPMKIGEAINFNNECTLSYVVDGTQTILCAKCNQV